MSDDGIVSFNGDYAVGADGASSVVRGILGIGMDSGPVLQHLVSVRRSMCVHVW